MQTAYSIVLHRVRRLSIGVSALLVAALMTLDVRAATASSGTNTSPSSMPASAAALEVRNDKIGVATHFSHKTSWMRSWNAERHMPMIAALGVGWIRDEITWAEIEPVRDQYRVPENTHQWIALANAHKLKIIVTFAGGNRLYEDQFDPEAYARAAAWLARELDGKIHVIEILNEPFSYYAAYYGEGSLKGGTWYGRNKDGTIPSWIARYVKLLNTAADAIKASNPRMPVIGLGNVTPQNWLQIEMGISRNVDGITDHPYSFRSPPEVTGHRDTAQYRQNAGFAVADSEGSFSSLVHMYREHLKKHDGPPQLWFTEFGYTTYREGAKNKKFLYSAYNEDAQAKYLLRRFMESLGLGVEMSIQYAFRDDQRDGGNPFEAENGFGLIRNDDSLKPSYHAVRNLAQGTTGFVPSDKLHVTIKPFSDRTEDRPPSWDGAPLPALRDIRHYQFTDSQGRTVIALWSAERIGDLNTRSADIEIQVDPADCTLSVQDLFTGEVAPLTGTASARKLQLSQFAVPPHPLLITIHSRSIQPLDTNP